MKKHGAFLSHAKIFPALTVTCVALNGSSQAADPAVEPIRLSVGPHLFVDDYLIASQLHLKRVIRVDSY